MGMRNDRTLPDAAQPTRHATLISHWNLVILWSLRQCSLSALAFLACGGSALAETNSVEAPTELKKLSLEELMNLPVTSVSRRPEPRVAAPAPIYVITEEDIRRAGVTTLADALRLAPGMQVARITANQWAVGVRGFGTRLARS